MINCLFLGGANMIVYKELTYNDIGNLTKNVVNQVRSKGFGIYSVVGSWTNHASGYSAIVSYNVYDDTATRVSGTIYAFTGEAYVFICNQHDVLKIANIGTMTQQ